MSLFCIIGHECFSCLCVIVRGCWLISASDMWEKKSCKHTIRLDIFIIIQDFCYRLSPTFVVFLVWAREAFLFSIWNGSIQG